MSTLHCIPSDRDESCDAPAVWWVWFKDLYPNHYTYACDQHLADYIERWKDTDHPVAQATRIEGGEVRRY